MREHYPVVIEKFNGLFDRGASDSVPIDHFDDCENIQFDHLGFRTRDGLDIYEAIANPVRIYNYVMPDGDTLLILDSNGDIYHRVDSSTLYGPILSLPDMLDFKFQNIAGRAYITPFQIEISALGQKSPRALQTSSSSGWIYVYKGDGTLARKAGGAPPTAGSLTLANGAAGNVEAGIHIIGVCYETDTGFLTKPTRLTQVTATGTQKIDVSGIPVSPDSFVVARRLVATVAIDPTLFTGNIEGYQLFFIPDGRIPDNVTTTLTVNFYDSELFSDASHLLDIMEEIPSCVGLTTYHGRMVAYSTYEDISIALVSYPGEPEAIDAVDGLIIIPLDGDPIINGQEFRDILYQFKKTRTYAVIDNGDVPSSWPVIVIDQGIGASVHGIGSVLDSGGVNIDYLLVVDWSGLMLFNGAYARPELTWKIEDRWLALDRNDFGNIQILNDSLNQLIYISIPNGKILFADYRNGLDAEKIRWAPWRFDVLVSSIALTETDTLVIASNGEV
jgi:hypothetical protein